MFKKTEQNWIVQLEVENKLRKISHDPSRWYENTCICCTYKLLVQYYRNLVSFSIDPISKTLKKVSLNHFLDSIL